MLSALVEPLASRSRDPLRRVALAWGEVCGPVLARHIRPLGFEDGVLAVGASDPQWRDAAFGQREALVRALRRYVPELRYLRLETVDAAPAPPAPRRPAPAPPDPRTAGIEDPGCAPRSMVSLAARAPPARVIAATPECPRATPLAAGPDPRFVVSRATVGPPDLGPPALPVPIESPIDRDPLFRPLPVRP
ncbi:MAG: DUF721 domain-containing protein [bacterium]